MKHFSKFMATLLAAAGTLAVFSLSAGAANSDYEFYGTPWDGAVSDSSPDDLTVYDSAVISSDTELSGKNVRIEKNGVLEITGGANVTLSSTNIFIENGGALFISDGTLTLDSPDSSGSYITAHGTLAVGSKGKISVKKGGLQIYPGSSFIDCGSVELVNETGFEKTLAKIKRYDKDFRLSDYSLYAHSIGGSTAQIQLRYCIGNIETGFKYTSTYGAKSGIKLKRSTVDLSRVYSKELREQLLDSVYAYEAENSLPADFENGKERSYIYTYSFAKNTLFAEYLYFTQVWDSGEEEEPVIMDNTKSVAVDIIP